MLNKTLAADSQPGYVFEFAASLPTIWDHLNGGMTQTNPE